VCFDEADEGSLIVGKGTCPGNTEPQKIRCILTKPVNRHNKP